MLSIDYYYTLYCLPIHIGTSRFNNSDMYILYIMAGLIVMKMGRTFYRVFILFYPIVTKIFKGGGEESGPDILIEEDFDRTLQNF